jgi:hypothetical protein
LHGEILKIITSKFNSINKQNFCYLIAFSYAGAGFTFGTLTAGTGIPAAIVACNSALGVCMAACIAAGLAPTP